ncbi:MAG: alpha/beta hydrolase [Pseudomonadota bacterium]
MKRMSLGTALLFGLVGCGAELGEPQVARGNGGPTVVFEAGLGDGAESWTAVRSRLPDSVGTFAWSRAGYGGLGLLDWETWPGDADGRRSGREVASQLMRELTKQGVEPPFVLVGHSLGGTYALSFAKAYPGSVAGIVLVDPRLPGFTAECQAQNLSNCTPPAALTLLMGETERAELRGMPETEASLRDLAFLNGIPVTVMSAGRGGLGISDDFQNAWIAYAEAFAERLPQARYVHVPSSGHYIHQSATNTVSAEIQRLLE